MPTLGQVQRDLAASVPGNPGGHGNEVARIVAPRALAWNGLASAPAARVRLWDMAWADAIAAAWAMITVLPQGP